MAAYDALIEHGTWPEGPALGDQSASFVEAAAIVSEMTRRWQKTKKHG